MRNQTAVLILIVSLITIMTACGEENQSSNGTATNVSEINLEPIEVELNAPQQVEVGEEAELLTFVKQGEEIVSDASEVVYEIWKDGKKAESEMIEATLKEEGIYTADYVFKDELFYYVQTHVTARGQHQMPVKEVQVGNAVKQVDSAENEENRGDHNPNPDENHDSSSSVEVINISDEMTVEWNPTSLIYSNEEVQLSATIEINHSAWEDGRVRFEIWKHEDEQRTWIEAEEIEPGYYEHPFIFEEAEEYHVMVHIEDESLHEHVEFMITVNDPKD